MLPSKSKSRIDAETDERGCGLLLIAILGLAIAVMLILGAWEEIVHMIL